jgi:hypothetical protein
LHFAAVSWCASPETRLASNFWRATKPTDVPEKLAQPARQFEMSDAQRIIEVKVSTLSNKPLTGLVQVNTPDAEIKFAITEDLAHKICTDLERFLTR